MAVTQSGFTGTYDIWYLDGRFTSGGGSRTGAGSRGPMRQGEGVLVEFRIGYAVGSSGSVIVDQPLQVIPD